MEKIGEKMVSKGEVEQDTELTAEIRPPPTL
jgi:hypothetical protein